MIECWPQTNANPGRTIERTDMAHKHSWSENTAELFKARCKISDLDGVTTVVKKSRDDDCRISAVLLF